MARIIIRIFLFFYCLYAFITFIVVMLVLSPLFLVAGLFGLNGRNAVYALCKLWGRAWFILIGIRHKKIFEVPHNASKQYIFIANHISYIDVPSVILAIEQPFRILGKQELTTIPVFGWIYRSAVITVDRSTTTARAKSVRALKTVIHSGISIFLFPEGGFNETGNTLKDFYDGAFRMAIETQTPLKPLLLLDGNDRLNYKSIWSLTPGNTRTVFLDEINVEGLNLKQLPELKKKVFDLMEERLQFYKHSSPTQQ